MLWVFKEGGLKGHRNTYTAFFQTDIFDEIFHQFISFTHITFGILTTAILLLLQEQKAN